MQCRKSLGKSSLSSSSSLSSLVSSLSSSSSIALERDLLGRLPVLAKWNLTLGLGVDRGGGEGNDGGDDGGGNDGGDGECGSEGDDERGESDEVEDGRCGGGGNGKRKADKEDERQRNGREQKIIVMTEDLNQMHGDNANASTDDGKNDGNPNKVVAATIEPTTPPSPPLPQQPQRRCTMGQNQVILRHQKFTFPRARE